MSEEIKKVSVDIAEEDLDEIAGGAQGDPVGGVDVGLKKKPIPTVFTTSASKPPVANPPTGSAG